MSAVVRGHLDAGVCLERIAELEQRWSRFLPDSEVSELNRRAGQRVHVSLDTLDLVEMMVDGWRATDGAFDPTMLGALVRSGYGASREDSDRVTGLPSSVEPVGRPDAIVVDRSDFTVTLPRGTAIDPGGVGKGLAADLVCAQLLEGGAVGVLVEIGGDIRVAGVGPGDDGSWTVDLTDHADAGRRLMLTQGGVATSSVLRRRWPTADGEAHHLIDPQSGHSTDNGVLTCTVVAGTAAWAEVFTKVAFTMKPDEVIARYDERSLAALVTLRDGASVASSAWRDFER